MLLYEWLERVTSDRGNAKALVYRDNYLSWRGLKHRVERRAQEFQAMGIRPGDWVGLMLGNVPDFVILALALSKLDATVVPIDPTTASREFELMFETAPLRALVTRPRGSETGGVMPPEPARRPLRPTSAEERRRAAAAAGSGDGAESRRRLQGTLLTCSVYRRNVPDMQPQPEVVTFTSDSAGDPKGVLRTRDNLIAETETLTRSLDLDPDTTALVAFPLFHSYGWDFFMTSLFHGSMMYLEEELSARRVIKILREQPVDVMPGTPTLYAALAKLPTAKPLKLKGARFLSAGAQLTEPVAEAFRERYGIRIMSTYHTTETGLVALDRPAKSPESVGKVVDGIETKITDAEGNKIGPTDAGVIWVKSPAVATRSLGPYEMPPPRAGKVPVGGRDSSGWYRTGDMGRMDKTGKLSLEGREDDLVRVDGKRVALGEVEGCLESFPKVKRAQVMVITDPLGGPMVVARVVPLAKVQAEELIDHCAKYLAPYKVPRRIEFCEQLG